VPPQRAGRVLTKGKLAVMMFHRAVAAAMPFGYVAGDEVHGRTGCSGCCAPPALDVGRARREHAGARRRGSTRENRPEISSTNSSNTATHPPRSTTAPPRSCQHSHDTPNRRCSTSMYDWVG